VIGVRSSWNQPADVIGAQTPTSSRVTVERLPALADAARERLATLGYDGIDVACRDGSLGWPEHAPYQVIVVTASAPRIPPALIDQLALGGRLVAPLGDAVSQRLVLVLKLAEADAQ
jgi:protein-L-isoaspartate(D-aspartate) O-methyltransferase